MTSVTNGVVVLKLMQLTVVYNIKQHNYLTYNLEAWFPYVYGMLEMVIRLSLVVMWTNVSDDIDIIYCLNVGL